MPRIDMNSQKIDQKGTSVTSRVHVTVEYCPKTRTSRVVSSSPVTTRRRTDGMGSDSPTKTRSRTMDSGSPPATKSRFSDRLVSESMVTTSRSKTMPSRFSDSSSLITQSKQSSKSAEPPSYEFAREIPELYSIEPPRSDPTQKKEDMFSGNISPPNIEELAEMIESPKELQKQRKEPSQPAQEKEPTTPPPTKFSAEICPACGYFHCPPVLGCEEKFEAVKPVFVLRKCCSCCSRCGSTAGDEEEPSTTMAGPSDLESNDRASTIGRLDEISIGMLVEDSRTRADRAIKMDGPKLFPVCCPNCAEWFSMYLNGADETERDDTLTDIDYQFTNRDDEWSAEWTDVLLISSLTDYE